jgi:tetratricopeptide (TPR) repeat protein
MYGSGIFAYPHQSVKKEQLSAPVEAKGGVQENVIPNLPEVPVAVPPDNNESNFCKQLSIGSIEELKNRANFSAKSGEYKESIEYYKNLVEKNPNDGSLWTTFGHCYLLDEKYQDAFKSYQKALNLLPDIKHPQLWYGIGLLYEKVSIKSNNSSKHMNMLYQHICVY